MALSDMFGTGNPYSSGLQVSGSGSNADFGVTMNPQTGMYQTTVGNTPLPIFTQSQWQGIDQGYGTTNQGITQGGSFIPTWKADPNYMAPNRMSSTGTDIPYNVSLAKADPGMLKAPSFAGGTYEYQRPGTADTTTASYSLDPKTGYYVPSNIQSQNGGDSWWQRNGIQTVDQVILAIGGGLAAAGSLGADAAGGAAGAGATGGSDAISNGTSLFAGDTLPGATTDLGTITSTASTLPADGITAGQVAGGVAGAGGVGGALSNTGSTGTPNMSTNSIPGNNFLPQNDPNLGLGQFNNPATNDPNMTSALNNNLNSMNTIDQTGGGTLQNIQQIGSGLQNLWNGGGSQIFNAVSGNNANQNIANNLMEMYNTAGAQAAPSVNTVNNTVSNPNQFFQSPFYQSLASLYGNNVNAQKNAAGTNGNPIDYTQKMMGFGAGTYDNYLNSINGVAQGMLGNQAKYGADYAFGTALGNTSGAASTQNGINGGMNLLSNAGSDISGLNSIYQGGSSLFNTIGSWF